MTKKTSGTFGEQANLLRALGHPTRLRILQILLEEDQWVKNIWKGWA